MVVSRAASSTRRMTQFRDADINDRVAAMLQEVLRRTHLSAAPDVGVVAAEEARRIGAESVVLYVIDYEQKLLVPVPAPDAAGRVPLSVGGTVAGRAFASTAILDGETESGGSRRVWLPLLDGTERTGVMEMTFPRREPLPEELVAPCERLSHLLAAMIVTKGAYSDFFERLRRRRPMTMASELLWELVPPMVVASDDVVLAALLEPCYDVGGDAFDYAMNEGVLQFAVFDAMGHGLPAAGMAAFALSTYRHSRRRDKGPGPSYDAIEAALFEQYAPAPRFVTGLIAELDIASGRLRWVNAGHPRPLLLRHGRLIKTLDVVPSPPMGMQLATSPPIVGEASLEPGDMVLLYTDGLSEARTPGGELFSAERLGEFIEHEAASGRAAPETLRRLREAIIERGEGALHDDATAMLVEWRRGSERRLIPDTV
jgi:stage II sporulation SpoE-like protein